MARRREAASLSDTKDLDKLLWEALEYIGRKTQNVSCPFCGNKTWVYAKRDDGQPRAALLTYTKTDDPVIIPAIPLTCDNCGFVRNHDIAMISTKLDEESVNG